MLSLQNVLICTLAHTLPQWILMNFWFPSECFGTKKYKTKNIRHQCGGDDIAKKKEKNTVTKEKDVYVKKKTWTKQNKFQFFFFRWAIRKVSCQLKTFCFFTSILFTLFNFAVLFFFFCSHLSNPEPCFRFYSIIYAFSVFASFSSS